MSSISIETARRRYPGFSDRDVAQEIAVNGGWHVIVAYTNKYTASDAHTNWGLCRFQEDVAQYLALKNAQVLYDDGCAESMQEAEAWTVEWIRAKRTAAEGRSAPPTNPVEQPSFDATSVTTVTSSQLLLDKADSGTREIPRTCGKCRRALPSKSYWYAYGVREAMNWGTHTEITYRMMGSGEEFICRGCIQMYLCLHLIFPILLMLSSGIVGLGSLAAGTRLSFWTLLLLMYVFGGAGFRLLVLFGDSPLLFVIPFLSLLIIILVGVAVENRSEPALYAGGILWLLCCIIVIHQAYGMRRTLLERYAWQLYRKRQKDSFGKLASNQIMEGWSKSDYERIFKKKWS